MHLAQYLRESRTSQEAFGDAIGVSQVRISQWLRGEEIPLGRCAAIEAATSGQVRCEDLRSDVAWTRDEHGHVTGYHVRVDAPTAAACAAKAA